jgi:uncharacterized protein YlxW (UPF0749 family)
MESFQELAEAQNNFLMRINRIQDMVQVLQDELRRVQADAERLIQSIEAKKNELKYYVEIRQAKVEEKERQFQEVRPRIGPSLVLSS